MSAVSGLGKILWKFGLLSATGGRKTSGLRLELSGALGLFLWGGLTLVPVGLSWPGLSGRNCGGLNLFCCSTAAPGLV